MSVVEWVILAIYLLGAALIFNGRRETYRRIRSTEPGQLCYSCRRIRTALDAMGAPVTRFSIGMGFILGPVRWFCYTVLRVGRKYPLTWRPCKACAAAESAP